MGGAPPKPDRTPRRCAGLRLPPGCCAGTDRETGEAAVALPLNAGLCNRVQGATAGTEEHELR